jgi:hypothetical protein
MTWQRREPAVYEGDGLPGGDSQISEAYSARWTRPLEGGLHAVVTRYYYVAAEDGQSPRIEEQTEYIACTDVSDPGSTERGADYGYRTVPWNWPFDDAAARSAAEQAPEPTVQEWAEMMPNWEVAG